MELSIFFSVHFSIAHPYFTLFNNLIPTFMREAQLFLIRRSLCFNLAFVTDHEMPSEIFKEETHLNRLKEEGNDQ